MPNLTHDQLQQWYKNFSRTLYRDVQLDVTRKEDLGRVLQFHPIGLDSTTEGIAAGAFVRYAFVPKTDITYLEPEPDYVDFDAHNRWLLENLNTEPSDQQIQELYDLSKLGLLTVRQPGELMEGIQQVRTDEMGNVTLSEKISTLIKADFNLNDALKAVSPPQLPEGFPEEPHHPLPPENMNPGFWSRVGYLLGMDTDYAKLMRYEEESRTFAQRRRDWETEVDNRREELTDYFAQKERYDEYLRKLDQVRKDPNNILLASFNGFRLSLRNQNGIDDPYTDHEPDDEELIFSKEYIDPVNNPWGTRPRSAVKADFYDKESQFLKKQHELTPMAASEASLAKIQRVLGFNDNFDKAVHHLLGPVATEFPLWTERKVYNIADYQPAPYQLESNPQRISDKDLAALASLACFAALSHPDVSGYPPKNRLSPEQTAQLNYAHILNDLFTQGRPNDKGGQVYVNMLPAARQKGAAAANAYARGNVAPLGELLGSSIRQTCLEIHCASSADLDSSHAFNSLYSVSKMLNLLDKDPELMNAAGLKPEELQEARAMDAYYQVVRKAHESNEKLLQHSLQQKDLSAGELKEALCDVLLANVLQKQISAEFDAWDTEHKASAESMKNFEDLIDSQKSTEKHRQAAHKAAAKKDDLQFMKKRAYKSEAAERDYLSDLSSLSYYTSPASAARAQLLDKNWVAKSRQQLMDTLSLQNPQNMDRSELGKVCSKTSTIVATFGTKAQPQAAGSKEPQPVNELQQDGAVMGNFPG